jgi:hypothetical protein
VSSWKASRWLWLMAIGLLATAGVLGIAPVGVQGWDCGNVFRGKEQETGLHPASLLPGFHPCASPRTHLALAMWGFLGLAVVAAICAVVTARVQTRNARA